MLFLFLFLQTGVSGIVQLIYDFFNGLIQSGFFTSKKTWITFLSGFSTVILIQILGPEFALSSLTVDTTAAFIVLLLLGIGLQDMVLGEIDWSELDDNLRKLFYKREFVATFLGVVVLWTYDLTGYRINDDLVKAAMLIWGVLIAANIGQSTRKVQKAATEIRSSILSGRVIGRAA